MVGVSDAALFEEPMQLNCATQRARDGIQASSFGQHRSLISRNRSLKKQTSNLQSFSNNTKFMLRALLGKVGMCHLTQDIQSKH